MNTFLITILCGALFSLSPLLVNAEELSFDDFVPPVKAGVSTPKDLAVKNSVKEKDGVVEAKNAQDGLNYALKELLSEDGDGVKEISVPSGFAVIAVSTQDYTTYENRTATLLSKRAAYAKAFTVAQKYMVGNFDGMMSVCEKKFSDAMQSIDTGADEGQVNTKQNSHEVCKETVSGVLAGYVLYYLKDNAPDDKSVTVAIASSTKTRNAIKKIGGSVVSTTDTHKAWEALMQEVTSGLVPPMGARIITNPVSGETVVIGFGSSIVRTNRDKSIARKLKKSSKRVAQMRANNALVSFLNGDKVYWQGGFDESQLQTQDQFESALPTQADGQAATPQQRADNIKVFDQTKSQFLNTFTDSNDYRVLTTGKLPPGIKQKSFIGKEGDWAIAISVYSIGMTARAESTGRENRTASGKLDKYQREGSSLNGDATVIPTTPSNRSLKTTGGIKDDAENPRGPSGQVTTDSNL